MTNSTTPLPVQEPAGAVEAIMALADAYAEAAQRGEDAMSIARKCSALRSALASLPPVTQAQPDASIPGPGMNASGESVDSAKIDDSKRIDIHIPGFEIDPNFKPSPMVKESEIPFGGSHGYTLTWQDGDADWEQKISQIMGLAEDWDNARHNFIVGDGSLADDERLFATKQALRQALWSFHAWHAVEFRDAVQPLREKIEALEAVTPWPELSLPMSENFYIARDQIKREFRRALGLRPDIGHSGQGTVGFCEQCDLVESMLNQFASSASTVPEWPDEQDPELLQAMKESNKWHFVDDVVPVLKAVKAGEWQWYENTRCKYIELRIDMRDLGCIIRDREKERISPATPAYQYSKSRNPGACSVTDGEA